ncbi:Glyoxylate/hydroxypyruvate reductase B [bacterium HR23]|nr:Glyoxylate/hydroxypyruvate reductase B [bacterium HR23]
MPKVVFFSFMSDEVNRIMASFTPPGFKVILRPHATPTEEKVHLLEDADFLIAYPGEIPAEALRRAKRLRLIQLLSAGYDRVDLALCRELGIPVANNGGANAWAVSEHAIGLLLALYKRLLDADRFVREGKWRGDILGYDTYEVADKTVGIIGLGRIGAKVARKFHAFEVARILYYDPIPRPDIEAQLGVQRVDLDTLLKESDIVSIHCPLTSHTRGLIARRELGLMKPTAVLINTARGPIVDEQALIDALRQKRIAGAGLDVFAQEPVNPNNPLLRLPNVVLSPHIAGTAYEGWARRARFAFANIKRVWEGKPPESLVEPEE